MRFLLHKCEDCRNHLLHVISSVPIVLALIHSRRWVVARAAWPIDNHGSASITECGPIFTWVGSAVQNAVLPVDQNPLISPVGARRADGHLMSEGF
jgi:hypothetical protein